MIKLHPEQQYVDDIARKLGIEYTVLKHDRATVTCAEKAGLLGWNVERVVKALYFHTGNFDDALIGIITPEFGVLDHRKIISKALGMDTKTAYRYSTNGFMPSGMSKGTCTPFPTESAMEKEIGQLVIITHPAVVEHVVDISLGDHFDEPHKTSMHISYDGIHKILKEKFGDRIVKYTN